MQPDWLASAVFYQVYPQSFADSNGDGIGDLPGLIGRLDHVAELGANGLWLLDWFRHQRRDIGHLLKQSHPVTIAHHDPRARIRQPRAQRIDLKQSPPEFGRLCIRPQPHNGDKVVVRPFENGHCCLEA